MPNLYIHLCRYARDESAMTHTLRAVCVILLLAQSTTHYYGLLLMNSHQFYICQSIVARSVRHGSTFSDCLELYVVHTISRFLLIFIGNQVYYMCSATHFIKVLPEMSLCFNRVSRKKAVVYVTRFSLIPLTLILLVAHV